jgi:hypothetical protein
MVVNRTIPDNWTYMTIPSKELVKMNTSNYDLKKLNWKIILISIGLLMAISVLLLISI